jgi:uncharacterized protein (TIGR03435 family)
MINSHRPRKLNRCPSLLLLAAAFIVLTAPTATAQATAPTPTAQTVPVPNANASAIQYDVVSIKPNKSGSGIIYNVDPPPDGYAVNNMPLKMLISNAYGIREDLISGGPRWIETDSYDVQAKVAGSDVAQYRKFSEQQRSRMVQQILAERFKLVVHTETKDLPVYELIVTKNGPKLREAKPNEQTGGGFHSAGVEAEAMPISALANFLSQRLQRAIVDKTGLTGKYDFNLKWADDHSEAPSSAMAAGTPSDPSSGLSLFTALQEQLGLKLQPAVGPVETLVIDHIEPPSPN